MMNGSNRERRGSHRCSSGPLKLTHLIVIDAIYVQFTAQIITHNLLASGGRTTGQCLQENALHAAQTVAQLRCVDAQIFGNVAHARQIGFDVRQCIDEGGQLRQGDRLRFLRQAIDHEVGGL